MESGASFRISQNLFHPIGVILAANLVVRRYCGLPQHNTTKSRWVFGHVLADHSICFSSVQVICSVGRRPIRTSGLSTWVNHTQLMRKESELTSPR